MIVIKSVSRIILVGTTKLQKKETNKYHRRCNCRPNVSYPVQRIVKIPTLYAKAVVPLILDQKCCPKNISNQHDVSCL